MFRSCRRARLLFLGRRKQLLQSFDLGSHPTERCAGTIGGVIPLCHDAHCLRALSELERASRFLKESTGRRHAANHRSATGTGKGRLQDPCQL